MSISHIVILGLIILIVVPPEKLPEILRNIGRIVGELKRQTSGLFDNIKTDITKDFSKDSLLTPEDMKKKLDDKSKQS
jgi:Sec-independent protein translocase protein TatA